jgi:acetyltransferase-like isoleucine patch superfamily enzyme
MMTARFMVCLLILPFPWVIRRLILSLCFGYKFAAGSIVGRSILSASKVSLGKNARISSLTIIRNLDELDMADNAVIGSFNWIHGYVGNCHFKDFPDRVSRLRMCRDSALTARHIVDCTDEVVIGEFATIAGHRSQILTHGIDIARGHQACAPVHVGRYSFVGTASILTKGVTVPSYSVIGAGSNFTKSSGSEEFALYAGNPAQLLRRLEPTSAYFTRVVGVVK